jgi:hypothetical protein
MKVESNNDPKLVRTYKGHKDAVTSVAIHPESFVYGTLMQKDACINSLATEYSTTNLGCNQ